jgi:hypothetical protein
MSVLSQNEKEQLYGSIKKLGLLAAEQLSRQEVTANRTKEQGRTTSMITEWVTIGHLRTAPEGRMSKW